MQQGYVGVKPYYQPEGFQKDTETTEDTGTDNEVDTYIR